MKNQPFLIFTSITEDPALVTMTTTVLDVAGAACTGASVKLHKNQANLPTAYVLAETGGNGIYVTAYDNATSYIFVCMKKGYRTEIRYIPAGATPQQSAFTVTMVAE